MDNPLLSLDVMSPGQVPVRLRATADRYRLDAQRLREAWQDPAAGKAWDEMAKALDRAAECAEAIAHKHGF